jgi:shikimate 5-dehydrogenase
LGMLIHQAKHSFNIWNNLIPDKNNLESLLRAV